MPEARIKTDICVVGAGHAGCFRAVGTGEAAGHEIIHSLQLSIMLPLLLRQTEQVPADILPHPLRQYLICTGIG